MLFSQVFPKDFPETYRTPFFQNSSQQPLPYEPQIICSSYIWFTLPPKISAKELTSSNVAYKPATSLKMNTLTNILRGLCLFFRSTSQWLVNCSQRDCSIVVMVLFKCLDEIRIYFPVIMKFPKHLTEFSFWFSISFKSYKRKLYIHYRKIKLRIWFSSNYEIPKTLERI